MTRRRRWSIENLEQRIVLDGVGPDDSPLGPDWESVIVSFHDDVANPGAVARGLVNAQGGQLGHVYEHAIKGFSAQLPESALQALVRHPQVKLVEPDLVMQAFMQEIPTGVSRINADGNSTARIDGIDDRVDVDIAIIDSGIDGDHPDLNVAGGYNATNGPSSNWDDGNGHGTHVAGTAAALDNGFGVVGVAPGARLWAVKVLGNNGSGRLSNVIEGIDWVTANAATIEVANMSLGGTGASSAYHTAIQNSVAAGIVYVVASGNSYRDILGTDFQFGSSDDTIPAAYPEVATISALADSDGQSGGTGGPTDYYEVALGRYYEDDEFADFSNFSNSDGSGNSWYDTNNKVEPSPGLGIDLMMPGVDILSTYKDGGYAVASGTSMAAPHAAGLAALHIAANAGSKPIGWPLNDTDVYGIRQALIDGGKSWFDEVETPSSGPTNDSPDNHPENLGWAGDGTPNQPPIADAGDPQSGNEDSLITFDASGSSDPDGDSLTFLWDFGDGQTAQSDSPMISHAYQYGGTFDVTLTVSDGRGGQGTAATTATVVGVNDPPVADAGGPYSGFENVPITFDASNSTDFDNLDGTEANDQVLTYTWDFGDGHTAETTSPTYSHTYAAPGTYDVTVTVSDGMATSSPALATAVIAAQPPGNPNDLYVWDIGFSSKARGKQGLVHRILVDVHRDSNADGLAGINDADAAGVSVTVELRDYVSDLLVGTFSGTTNDNGRYESGWIRGLEAGKTYQAKVVDMVHATYDWNTLLDPNNDDDEDVNDGYPFDLLIT